MTIEAKYDIGKQVIVDLDGGLEFSKIVEVYARAQPDKTTITYITNLQQIKLVQNESGERKVKTVREIFISEERAEILLGAFNVLRHDQPDAAPELLLAELSRLRKKSGGDNL